MEFVRIWWVHICIGAPVNTQNEVVRQKFWRKAEEKIKTPKFIHRSINSRETSSAILIRSSAENDWNKQVKCIHTRNELSSVARQRRQASSSSKRSKEDGRSKTQKRGWSFNELDKNLFSHLPGVSSSKVSGSLSARACVPRRESCRRFYVSLFSNPTSSTATKSWASTAGGEFTKTLSHAPPEPPFCRAVNMLKLECLLRYHPILLSNIKKSVPIFTTFGIKFKFFSLFSLVFILWNPTVSRRLIEVTGSAVRWSFHRQSEFYVNYIIFSHHQSFAATITSDHRHTRLTFRFSRQGFTEHCMMNWLNHQAWPPRFW